MGPFSALRSSPCARVAPTTSPTVADPSAFCSAASSTIVCPTARSPVVASCTPAPSGLDVRASTKTPRPPCRAASIAGDSEPNPRYGETVTASAHSGDRSSSHAWAYACIVEPMSPRLASASTTAPAARHPAMTDSNTANPAAPNASKNATCGLITAATGPSASTQTSANCRSPVVSTGNPHCSSNSTWGSIPAHSLPRSATADR